MAVDEEGAPFGLLADLALLDRRHAHYLLVVRRVDGRIVRVGADAIDTIDEGGVHLRRSGQPIAPVL